METDPGIRINTAPRMVQSSTPREVNVDSEGESLREQYERLEVDQQEEPFLSREAQFHADLDAQLANLQVEMSVLTPDPILQPESLQMRPPRMGQPLWSGDYPAFDPIQDPVQEYDNSLARMQRIYQRHQGGFDNSADYDDMVFALAREQSKFEFVCGEILRHNTRMLEGLHNRHLNYSYQQPGDNEPRWINVPDFGTMFTNAKIFIQGGDGAESTAMGELRNREPRLEDTEFQLDMLANSQNPGSLRNIEQDIARGSDTTDQQNAASPGFRCTINEDDMVAAFLKDTPSNYEELEIQNEEATESSRGRDKGKERTCVKWTQKMGGESDKECRTWGHEYLKLECQGAWQPLTIQHGRNLVKKFNVVFCFLMETKTNVEHATKLTRCWGFNSTIGVNSMGLSGGILLLWKDDVKASIVSMNKNISFLYLQYGKIKMWLACLYGHPDPQHRGEVWEQLMNISKSIAPEEEWLVMGDFNQVLKAEDKLSSTSNSIRGASKFQDCLNQCSLAEISNKGLHFTWTNGRGEGNQTWERLDRAFANAAWLRKFEDTILTNLPITMSDHSPMILQFDKQEAYKVVQKLKITRNELRKWNKEAFGDVFRRKRILEERLTELQQGLDIKQNTEDERAEVYTNQGEASEQEIRQTLQVLDMPKLADEHVEILERQFTEEEVSETAFQINPSKVPGIDGKPGVFFQKFWDIVGLDTIKATLAFLNTGAISDNFTIGVELLETVMKMKKGR
ncbi:Endonuclease/exonuclease/phosphatase [Corchorus olitorius]|uniref:Endonuclease/exonuclease/phosphatase n=1 Tax=Corchorus olitorius TaxID=93759 RepID=A0A1R3I6N3_9ROSI|nr:Endonuclease/exonuclease/phosphatase [Corchorus olitorius]